MNCAFEEVTVKSVDLKKIMEANRADDAKPIFSTLRRYFVKPIILRKKWRTIIEN